MKAMLKWFIIIDIGLVLIGLLIVIILFRFGILGRRSEYNNKEHVDAAIAYMNDRYKVNFREPEENTQRGSGDTFGRHSEAVNILLCCDELPGKKIEVFSRDGVEFYDDYICRKYEDQATQDIKDII